MSVKRALLNENNEAVLMFKSNSEAASREVLDMLVDYLPQRFPNMFRKTENSIDNLITNESFALTDETMMHPLDIASRLVQEDLVIVQYDASDELYHANVCQFIRNVTIHTIGFFDCLKGVSCLFLWRLGATRKVWQTTCLYSYT